MTCPTSVTVASSPTCLLSGTALPSSDSGVVTTTLWDNHSKEHALSQLVRPFSQADIEAGPVLPSLKKGTLWCCPRLVSFAVKWANAQTLCLTRLGAKARHKSRLEKSALTFLLQLTRSGVAPTGRGQEIIYIFYICHIYTHRLIYIYCVCLCMYACMHVYTQMCTCDVNLLYLISANDNLISTKQQDILRGRC